MSIIFKGNLTDHFTADDYAINQTSNVTLTQESYEHALMLEEFRQWLKRPIEVHAWYLTASYNKKVGGASNSSHLKGLATDWHTNITITEEKFIKYAKKWKEICERHNCVGEAGLYTWGVHLGSHITYSKTFYHWDSRSGKQLNKPFKI